MSKICNHNLYRYATLCLYYILLFYINSAAFTNIIYCFNYKFLLLQYLNFSISTIILRLTRYHYSLNCCCFVCFYLLCCKLLSTLWKYQIKVHCTKKKKKIAKQQRSTMRYKNKKKSQNWHKTSEVKKYIHTYAYMPVWLVIAYFLFRHNIYFKYLLNIQ